MEKLAARNSVTTQGPSLSLGQYFEEWKKMSLLFMNTVYLEATIFRATLTAVLECESWTSSRI